MVQVQVQVVAEARLANASNVEGKGTGRMVRPILHLIPAIHGSSVDDSIIACPNTVTEGRGSSTVKRARTESFQADSLRVSGRSVVQGECYKCHQPGHWANACPNEEGAGNKYRDGGGKTGTRGRRDTKRGRGSGNGGRGKRGRGGPSKKGGFAAADDWD